MLILRDLTSDLETDGAHLRPESRGGGAGHTGGSGSSHGSDTGDFVLAFEPVDTETHPTATHVLGLMFSHGLGMVDTSLRLTLFLGFIKQFVIWTDPNSLLCYRAISSFFKLRSRPARMERQPLVKVLAEQFPRPNTMDRRMGRGRQGRMLGYYNRRSPGRGDKKETEKEIAPPPPPRKLKPPDQAAAEAEPSS